MNKTQREIIDTLTALWDKNPKERFGQLLFNYSLIGIRAGQGKVLDPFWYSDIEMLNSLKDSLRER